METVYDQQLGKTIQQAKLVPVLIKCLVGKKYYEKFPDKADFDLIERIAKKEVPYNLPIYKMPYGYNTQQPKESHGLTHLHHFYTKRNLWVLEAFRNIIKDQNFYHKLLWIITGIDTICSRLLNYRVSGSGKPTPLKGTLYISSLYSSLNVSFWKGLIVLR